jgi:hypothetical protein
MIKRNCRSLSFDNEDDIGEHAAASGVNLMIDEGRRRRRIAD